MIEDNFLKLGIIGLIIFILLCNLFFIHFNLYSGLCILWISIFLFGLIVIIGILVDKIGEYFID